MATSVLRRSDAVDVAALMRELAELRGRVERLEEQRASGLRQRDRELLSTVAPAIVGLLGSEWFTVAELRRFATLRQMLAGWSNPRLGKLLRRTTGIVVDGFVIERGGDESGVAVWRILGVVGGDHRPDHPEPSRVRQVRA